MFQGNDKNLGVTIAKGITIILMVFGHTTSFDYANNYLLLMRMPLFFVMSGYCFKVKYIDDGSRYIRRRVTGIYRPYVLWSLLFLLLHNFFLLIHFYNAEALVHGESISPYGLKETLLRAGDIVLAMQGHEPLLGGYWFLHDLFFGSLLFYLGLKLIRNRFAVAVFWLLVASILAVTGWRIRYIGVNSHLFLAAFFISVGHCYRMGNWKWARRWKYIITVAIALYAISLLWHSSMVTYHGWEVFPYSACAVAGSLMLFGIGEQLSRCSGKIVRFLSYTGGKTFNVLTWHLISLKLVSLIIITIYGLRIETLAEFPIIREYANNGWWLAYFIIGVGLPLVWSYYYDRVKEAWIKRAV